METAFVTEFENLEVREVNGQHELFGICVPYNRRTTKAGALPELFRPGSLAGAVPKAGQIRLVDENHQLRGRRPVGVGTVFEERGDEGMFGRFRYYNTPEGRAALENTMEGTYGGLSVGFVAVREQLVDGTREILEARLHHVSLVDEPAYEEARILAVRGDDTRIAYWEQFRRPLDLVLDADDTPMSVRVRRIFGDVRIGG
jgi:HK97 family phage prohead protease